MDKWGRQFSTRSVPDWPTIRFGDRRLWLHPKLTHSLVRSDTAELLILGHIVDPRDPGADNEAIAAQLLSGNDFETLERRIAKLGGRWLLFARIKAQSRLYPDACSTRSAFFSQDGGIASQPTLLGLPIASLVELPDADAFPLGYTPHPGVRQLIANHYLDLTTFRRIRFGPRTVPAVPLTEATRSIRALLRGTLEALARRGTLALPLTAGFDSRPILAAAEGLDLHVFTVKDRASPRHDVIVPRKLARLSRRHLRIVTAGDGDDLAENVGGLWRDPHRNRVASFSHARFTVLGTCSEILRCYYWPDGRPREPSAPAMSRAARCGGKLVEVFEEWIAGLPPGIDPWDLLYWESRLGGWHALDCTAFDAYTDVIPAYNCRELLETGLGVEIQERCSPYAMHRELADNLAAVPYNECWVERVKRIEWLPWRLRALLH